jgi:hypothetical protein
MPATPPLCTKSSPLWKPRLNKSYPRIMAKADSISMVITTTESTISGSRTLGTELLGPVDEDVVEEGVGVTSGVGVSSSI